MTYNRELYNMLQKLGIQNCELHTLEETEKSTPENWKELQANLDYRNLDNLAMIRYSAYLCQST